MSDLSQVLGSLIEKWQAEGTKLVGPLSYEYVVAALNKTGRRYCTDVVELYCAIGGMADCDMDSRCWSLWPLADLITENAGHKRSELLFADFLIHSHVYSLGFESETNSSVWIDFFNGEEPEKVAQSLCEFFETMLRSPRLLHLFDD